MTAVQGRALAGLVVGFAATVAAVTLYFAPVFVSAPVTNAPPEASVSAQPGARSLSIPFVRTAGAAGDEYVAATFAGSVHIDASGGIAYALPGGVTLREHSAYGAVRSVHGGDPSAARVSVFRGRDPSQWRSGMPTFETVHIDDLVPGVDLDVAAGARNVEKRFHVAPGVDADRVRMRFESTDGLNVLPDGRLEVTTELGSMTFTAPVAFHETADGRVDVPARYVVDGDVYGFALDGRDPALPLVIDPLIASTYLGGGTAGDNLLNDNPEAIAHFAHSVYVVGKTQADIFPSGYAGSPAYQDHYGGGWTEAFVCRLSEDLSTVEAVTFLGGGGEDVARDVAVTADGVWIVGTTDSGGFPTTFGAYQPNLASTSYDDAFVTRLTHDLETLTASTFLGGESDDQGDSIVIDPALGIVVAGRTRSVDSTPFSPEMALPYQRNNNGGYDAFVTRFDPDLGSINAGTLYGGSSSEDLGAVALMGSDVLICGETSSTDLLLSATAVDKTLVNESDGYVARFDQTLGKLSAATYLGGEGTLSRYPYDECLDIAAYDGEIFVCGSTSADDFPATAGAFDETPNDAGEYMSDDAFVVRMPADLSAITAATFVGGDSSEAAESMVIHPEGIVIVGRTSSDEFPMPNSSEDDELDGNADAYVFVLTHDLDDAIDGRFLGGAMWEGATGVCLAGETVFVTGATVSVDFPTTDGAFDEHFNDELNRDDGFIVALDMFEGGVTPPPIEIDSYILPKRLDVRHNAKRPSKSWLNAGGWFDTGSGAVDWSLPATLTIGDTDFDIPGLSVAKKGWLEWSNEALFFRIKPSKYKSSKGKFKLKWKSEAVMSIPIDAPLIVRFVNNDVDAIGEVTLKEGRYKLGRQRGALIQPRLALYSCKTTLKGDDKDGLRARLGLSTEGGVPHDCPPLTIGLNDQFVDTIDSDAFDLRGRKFVFKGPKGGLSKATVDFGKEKLAIHGKKVDVGQFPEGPQTVSVLVRLGDDALLLRVRMVRSGKTMRY